MDTGGSLILLGILSIFFFLTTIGFFIKSRLIKNVLNAKDTIYILLGADNNLPTKVLTNLWHTLIVLGIARNKNHNYHVFQVRRAGRIESLGDVASAIKYLRHCSTKTKKS